MSDVRRDLVGLLPRLRRFALTLTRNGREADALVQEICERAVAHSRDWHGRGRLESWLYTMMQSAWIDDTRKRGPLYPANSDRKVMALDATATGDHDAVSAAILSMPDDHAGLFLLVAIEKHSYREAGEILGLSESTVAGHMAAARLFLADLAAQARGKRA